MQEVVAAIIHKNWRFLIAKRKAHRQFPATWEFPGGKIEEGETLKVALYREIQEELGINIEYEDILLSSYNKEANCNVTFILCTTKEDPILKDHDGIIWVTAMEIFEDKYPLINSLMKDALKYINF